MRARFRLPRLAAVALGSFALGAWLFRGSTSSAPASTAAQPRAHDAASRALSTAAPSAPSPAPHATLLADLRAKLPHALEQVLQSLSALGKTDPALAIDLAHELGRTDREKAAWVTQAMQQWADRDPSAAWQWLRTLTNDRMQELAGGELGSVVLGAMTTRDPQLVVTHLDALLRNGNASESISTPVAVHLGLAALVEHGKTDLAKSALEAWARDPRQLTLEAAAFETVATSLARTQPRETGDWLRALPTSEERNAAFATFSAAWAKHDPHAALLWAETLPPHEGQLPALRRTVSDWIEEFPTQVSSWLGDYLARTPPGPTADALIETVINNSPALRAAPQAALPWTDLISDPAKRVDYHERIALRWAEQNPDAALDFVAKTSLLPPARKTAVTQQIQLGRLAAKSGN